MLCRFESAAMQSFKSDTGGRNGLSLQREKKGRGVEVWGDRRGRGGGRGRSVGVCVY